MTGRSLEPVGLGWESRPQRGREWGRGRSRTTLLVDVTALTTESAASSTGRHCGPRSRAWTTAVTCRALSQGELSAPVNGNVIHFRERGALPGSGPGSWQDRLPRTDFLPEGAERAHCPVSASARWGGGNREGGGRRNWGMSECRLPPSGLVPQTFPLPCSCRGHEESRPCAPRVWGEGAHTSREHAGFSLKSLGISAFDTTCIGLNTVVM